MKLIITHCTLKLLRYKFYVRYLLHEETYIADIVMKAGTPCLTDIGVFALAVLVPLYFKEDRKFLPGREFWHNDLFSNSPDRYFPVACAFANKNISHI